MNNTNIAWTKKTWNPITGCSEASEGCKNCYAKKVHERFYDTSFSEITLHPDRLIEPIKVRKDNLIFLGSMTDIFHESIPDEWIDEIFHVMMRARFYCTFQILTKRPERMKKYINELLEDGIGRISSTPLQPPLTPSEIGFVRRWDKTMTWESRDFDMDAEEFLHGNVSFAKPFKPLGNIWFGTTVENQRNANNRILPLLEIPVTNRFLSIEPLIDEINLVDLEPHTNAGFSLNSLTGFYNMDDGASTYGSKQLPKIDWVIVGGEIGAKKDVREMSPKWVQKIYNDCLKYDIPFFFKQWGAFKTNLFYDFENIQQFPKGY